MGKARHDLLASGEEEMMREAAGTRERLTMLGSSSRLIKIGDQNL